MKPVMPSALVTEIADATFDLRSDPLAREEIVIVAPAARETPQLTDLPGGMRSVSYTHLTLPTTPYV